MLACARVGAIHSIVFGGFSPDSLQNRVEDADSKLVITADESMRGGKAVPLKKNADVALQVQRRRENAGRAPYRQPSAVDGGP
jgi:acetyl-CoA synthetase